MSVDFYLKKKLTVKEITDKMPEVRSFNKDDKKIIEAEIDGKKCWLAVNEYADGDIYYLTAYGDGNGIDLFEKIFDVFKIPFVDDGREDELMYEYMELEEVKIKECIEDMGYFCEPYYGEFIITDTKEELYNIIGEKEVIRKEEEAKRKAKEKEIMDKNNGELPF